MEKIEYWVLCGGVDPPYPISEEYIVRLDTTKVDQQTVKLRVEDISRALIKDVPDTLVDLLEIAAYVYCGDQAVSRGSDIIRAVDTKWYPTLHFVIPVRQADFWSNRELVDLLSRTLNFLYGGTLTFRFIKHPKPPPLESYLDFGQVVEAEEVVLFSGGLDSLSGTIQEIAVHKRHVALVSHRSVSGMYKRQDDLFQAIKERFPDKKVDHVPIWVHKRRFREKADTQRTRSFLFASLAVTVAKLLKLSRIRFYENGVTSINLPIATELLGTRASRTTHPQVLHYFNELFSLITEDEFKVENPFALKTKTEVVSLLGKENCEELIKETVSCSGTRHSIKTKRHCCSCTQCIDRRFATLANGYERFDPESLYSLDLLTGPREPGEQRALALSFVKKALEIEDMTEHGFFREFGEASRAVDYLDGRTGENAEKIFNLYNRHAEVVSRVMEEGIQRHTKALLRHELPAYCLLVMAVDYDSLPKEAEAEGAFSHSDDFRSINYNGFAYTLTSKQAEVVKLLYNAWEQGTPDIGQGFILTKLDPDDKRSNRRLRDVFKSTPEVWGTLIIPGSKKGTYRLNI
ncbi:MAG: 7-cyano-7-deazaguanine synthase [Calditrichaceae bacterium]|nr:7-cyano-7-deazaguanine synthase [Calditrichia bacterium]NUQ40630.1 7-cyano-7-deazaguanine synthase [Calditrichaceae bacterium]